MAEATTLPQPSALTAGLKPILLLIGIAAAVAAGVTVVLWTRGPSYSLLYANIAAEDQSTIAQALDAAQIPYRIQPGSNNIEVAAERVAEARMKLAGQGLPESSGSGFAQMDKDPGFGVSQFVENARYQHALETELARTISNLRPVEGARVHLAIPRQTAFVRDHHPASAFVNQALGGIFDRQDGVAQRQPADDLEHYDAGLDSANFGFRDQDRNCINDLCTRADTQDVAHWR